MINLRVRLINAPQWADVWALVLRQAPKVPLGHGRWLGLNETTDFNVPADWEFPIGFTIWVMASDAGRMGNLNNIWPASLGFIASPGVPGLGEHTLDWAAGRFVVPVVDPVPVAEFANLTISLARV